MGSLKSARGFIGRLLRLPLNFMQTRIHDSVELRGALCAATLRKLSVSSQGHDEPESVYE